MREYKPYLLIVLQSDNVGLYMLLLLGRISGQLKNNVRIVLCSVFPEVAVGAFLDVIQKFIP
jgi:hypothetical protein